MEMRQLRYFVVVSEVGSLLRASARLHIAQPALGQQIQALEDELGVKLFHRSNRGMSLTETGVTFLEHARVILADTERARQAVRSFSTEPSGKVTIGFPMTVGLTAALPILVACRQRFPKIQLKIVEAYSGFLREWLMLGRLDLALMFGETIDPGLAKRPLLDDRLVFVTSMDGNAVPQCMGMEDISRWPLVLPSQEHGLRRIIDEACVAEGLTLDVVAEVDSLSSVKRAVQTGIGNTILPLAAVAQEVQEGQLHAVALDNPRMSRRVVCATNTARPANAAATAVNSLVHEVVHDMVVTGAWPATWIGPPP